MDDDDFVMSNSLKRLLIGCNNNGQSKLEKATSLGSCRILLSYHVMSCHGRRLGFDRTRNSAIRSADSRTPVLFERAMLVSYRLSNPLWP